MLLFLGGGDGALTAHICYRFIALHSTECYNFVYENKTNTITYLYRVNTIEYIYIYTVKPLYKKLFFFSNFYLIERFSYKEVFTFPMILRINL